MTPRYTDDDVRNALREAKQRLDDEPLTANRYRSLAADQDDWPTARTIINRHSDEQNAWMAALSDAGVLDDPTDHHGFGWGRYDAQNGIRHVAAQIAEWPTGYRYEQEFSDRELQGIFPAKQTIQSMYGTWEKARKAAKKGGQKLDRLIEDGPTHIETLTKHRFKTYTINSFSVWGDDLPIYYLDGHDKQQILNAWIATNKSLVEARNFKNVQHNAPSDWWPVLSDILANEYPNEWADAFPGRPGRLPSHAYSREELVEAVRQAAKDCGEPLTWDEYRRWANGVDGRPSGALLSGRHRDVDSWMEFCADAGVETKGE